MILVYSIKRTVKKQILPLILIGLLGFIRTGTALELHPCAWQGWNHFILSNENNPLVSIQVNLTTEPGPHPSYFSSGILEGVRGRGGAYHLCSWPALPPDRLDHFSARWSGHWLPGETTCEIRLRADDQALLRLDGEDFLQVNHSPQGATRTIQLSPRRHRLEVTYFETTGNAFVFVDWRIPGGSWGPLIPKTGNPDRELEGWLGEYYIDQEMTRLAYTQIDPFIGFNWKETSPFDRADDLPSLTWEWNHDGGKVLSQLTSNRDGYLRLTFSSATHTPITLEGGNTFFRLVDHKGEAIQFQFDDSGTWYNGPSQSPNLAPIELPTDVQSGQSGITLEIPLNKDNPIRFWQPDTDHQTGSAVGQSLAQSSTLAEEERFKIEGDLAHLNAQMETKSDWWIHLLLSNSALLVSSSEMTRVTGEPPIGNQLSNDQVHHLIHSVSAYCHLFSPDSSLPAYDPLVHQIPLLLRTSSPEAVTSLQSALTQWEKLNDQTANPKASPPIPAEYRPVPTGPFRWQTFDLAAGLAEALSALADLSRIINTTPDGLVLNQSGMASKRLSLKNLKIGNRLWDISSGQWGVRFEDKAGGFIQLDAVSQITNLHISKRGDWIADLQVPGNEGRVAVGPSERIRSARWQKKPLLLLKGKSGEQQGKISGSSGRLEIRFADDAEPVLPRY